MTTTARTVPTQAERNARIDYVNTLLAGYTGRDNSDGTNDYDTATALIIRYGITADDMNERN